MRSKALMLLTLLAACAREPEVPRNDPDNPVPFAKYCVATLNARDPAKDARTAFVAGDRWLLSWYEGGIGEDIHTPLIGCVARQINEMPIGLPKLPLGHAVMTDGLGEYESKMSDCFAANERYGAAYNREMLKLVPKAADLTCDVDESGRRMRSFGSYL